jgi:hypothetical protein
MPNVPSTEELLTTIRKGTAHLEAMATKLEFPWNPDTASEDPRKLHNVYARNLITSYVSRFADLSRGLLSAVEAQNYMVYALAGRSLIEITATLRYYVTQKYKPLLDKGNLSIEDMRALIKIDDQHLRGSRFDWESFLFRRYDQLKEDAVKKLKDKKAKIKSVSESILQEQINVQTCIEKWAEETPGVLIAYSLFCDLVHPNIGSTFLIASIKDGQLFFSRSKGHLVATGIFEQSLPILVSVTHKLFGDYLFMLMATIWKDDEVLS